MLKAIGVPSLCIFFNRADESVVMETPDYAEMIVEDTLEVADKLGYKDVKYAVGSALVAKDSVNKMNSE